MFSLFSSICHEMHHNFWIMKTAPCGQDTTQYGTKPLLWKIFVCSNYCWGKILTFQHFWHLLAFFFLEPFLCDAQCFESVQKNLKNFKSFWKFKTLGGKSGECFDLVNNYSEINRLPHWYLPILSPPYSSHYWRVFGL